MIEVVDGGGEGVTFVETWSLFAVLAYPFEQRYIDK
jgi:hypothetical protein|tara:strand:- start:52 stop:159 length:108 start_codon:yes stop_codon:yes gene_type:complete